MLSLLDATDDDGECLNDRQIRDEVMTLLFAGHDTTTSTIGLMFYELARHPDVAAALRDEQGPGARRRASGCVAADERAA
ncbi:MAG: cytochrome P450 [Solirubrobacteraceae bacterium]